MGNTNLPLSKPVRQEELKIGTVTVSFEKPSEDPRLAIDALKKAVREGVFNNPSEQSE